MQLKKKHLKAFYFISLLMKEILDIVWVIMAMVAMMSARVVGNGVGNKEGGS